jgi:SAM-dependent methyltransferase
VSTQSISFERAADFYDETRGGLGRGRRFAPILAAQLPPGAQVLEVGVGTGAVALPLLELGFDVVGVDIAHSMLVRARERCGARVAKADGAQLPIASASRDAVVAVWVLHVAGDRESVLVEVARVLRPRGRLVVVCADAVYEPDEIIATIGDMRAKLGRVRDIPEVTIPLALDAGLQFVAQTRTERFEHPTSPEDIAAQLERRDMSSLWDLDEETWNRVVQPVIDDLRALPDPQRPRPTVASHPVLVFERPA